MRETGGTGLVDWLEQQRHGTRRKKRESLVPCQGLDFGYVIAKRPPLSDFALSPTRIF